MERIVDRLPEAVHYSKIYQTVLDIFENEFHEEPMILTLTALVTGQVFQIYIENGMTGLHLLIREQFVVNAEYDEILIDEWRPSVFDFVTVDAELYEGGCTKADNENKLFTVGGLDIVCLSPKSRDNNCLFDCIRHYRKISETNFALRKRFGVKGKIDEVKAAEIIEILIGEKPTILTPFSSNEEVLRARLEKCVLFLNREKHYCLVTRIKFKEPAPCKSKQPQLKKGKLFYDIESRNFCPVATRNGETVWRQKEVILAIRYNPADSPYWYNQIFESYKLEDGSWYFAGKQFLDWLVNDNRCYECYAHNGSRFDIFFLLSYLAPEMLVKQKTQYLNMTLRGCSILKYNFNGSVFKDTCAFLTKDLKSLCDDFKPAHRKLDDTELCFYKPELDFAEFVNLKNTETDFWDKYTTYCLTDVISLQEIWSKFETELNVLLKLMCAKAGKPENHMLDNKCTLQHQITIGAMAKKAFTLLVDEKTLEQVSAFTETDCETDFSKLEYLKNFVRGGISYVQYPGKHAESIALYDIKSMYPAAMIYMRIPIGESFFLEGDRAKTACRSGKYGFYHLKNVKFSDNRVKPIACTGVEPAPRIGNTESLCWNLDFYEELYIDSYMLRYLYKLGLESFDVVDCLVSDFDISGNELFSAYVRVLYAKKQEQDKLPKEQRNNALRETIKLFLNSLSGKMVEDPSRHSKYKRTDQGNLFINRGLFEKQKEENQFNALFPLGLMIYSYSKRLLWEYIQCLPNKEKDIIASETDSIYIPDGVREVFESKLPLRKSRDFPCIGIGEKLGNFAFEGNSTDESFFIGKKQYYYGSDKPKMKFKGCREKYINAEGKFENVLTKRSYEELMETGTVSIPQSCLERKLTSNVMDDLIHIESVQVVKKFKANYEFKNWDFVNNAVAEI